MSYDSWWVVTFRVDIKRLFDRFPEWEKVFSCRIKGFTSKKSLLQSLVSMVIASPSFLKKAVMFFLNLRNSISYLFYPSTTILLLITASPPSLYNPTLFSLPVKLDNLSRRHETTNSQISAPSKHSIVTSNDVSPPFLTQVPPLLKSS